MSMAAFIRANELEIIDGFEGFARTLTPVAAAMTPVELRDHAHELLLAIAADLDERQTAEEQSRKSMGLGVKHAMAASGHLHADARISHRFSTNQVVAEFRALRASVLRLYAAQGTEVDADGMARFNEAVDEALAASVDRFADRVGTYKDQFIGMLSHDLRTPLSAITAGAGLLAVSGDEQQRVRVASRILSSAQRMSRMIADLLDLTRTRLGGGIPISRRPADLREICQVVILEIQVSHPDLPVHYEAEGDLLGNWDPDRLSQVIANLLGNALQHGDAAGARVAASGTPNEVVVSVHNRGPAIPDGVQQTMFEPLARYAPNERGTTTSIGLGLFIARAIVVEHGGTISVCSTEQHGTTFEVRLPRLASMAAAAPA